MIYSRLPRLVFTINYLNSTYKYNHTVKRFYLITYTEKIRPKRPRVKGKSRNDGTRNDRIRYLFISFCLLIYSCISIRAVRPPMRYLLRNFFEKAIVSLSLSVMRSSCFHIEQSAILIQASVVTRTLSEA